MGKYQTRKAEVLAIHVPVDIPDDIEQPNAVLTLQEFLSEHNGDQGPKYILDIDIPSVHARILMNVLKDQLDKIEED